MPRPAHSPSHQRAEQPQHAVPAAHGQAAGVGVLLRDLAADGEQRVKITAHIGHGAAAAEPAGVLKVQVQAAKVKINRTYNGFRAVGYALLRVDEPGAYS